MDTAASALHTQLDGIAARRRVINKLIIILKRKIQSRNGSGQCRQSIRSLREAELCLRQAESVLRLQRSPDLPHQPSNSSEGAATRHQVDENANSNPEYIVAGNAANYSESAAAAKSDARASSAAGIGVASKPTTNSVEPKETDDIGEDNRIPEFHHPGIPIELYIEYEPLGPEVKSSQHATELELELWYEYKCGTKDLKGAYFGTFGDTNRHAVVAYSSRHLSAWSPNDPYTLTNLTDVLPKCNIKTLVPLSDEILGLVADVKSEKGTYTRNRMMLFDINAALDEEPREAPLSAIWPNIMPGSTGVSKISWLGTRDGHTYFLSSAINSNEVHVHSFTQDNGAFTDISNTRMNVYLKNPVSAIGFDPVYSVAVAGSVRSQMSVVDVVTGSHISYGWLNHKGRGDGHQKITNLSICPTSPHLVMATCSTRNSQFKIVDLRMPICPVLSCGMELTSNYSEELVPAMDPQSSVIVAPFNSDQTRNGKNVLRLFDTRFSEFRNTKAACYSKHKTKGIQDFFCI